MINSKTLAPPCAGYTVLFIDSCLKKLKLKGIAPVNNSAKRCEGFSKIFSAVLNDHHANSTILEDAMNLSTNAVKIHVEPLVISNIIIRRRSHNQINTVVWELSHDFDVVPTNNSISHFCSFDR